MNIDKAKLKLGIWYEDENGNVINQKRRFNAGSTGKGKDVSFLFPFANNGMHLCGT